MINEEQLYKESEKECAHKNWEHILIEEPNMNNIMCLWLVHQCIECKIQSDGLKISSSEEAEEIIKEVELEELRKY